MKNELEKLIEAAKNYKEYQSIGNGAKLNCAIEAAELALQQPDVNRSKSAAWKEGYEAANSGYWNQSYKRHEGTETHKEWCAGFTERKAEKDNE